MASDIRKIPKEQGLEAEKWNPPLMGSSKTKVFKSEKQKPKGKPVADQEIQSTPIPTADDIEKWHKQAHEEGYQQGLKKAQQEIAQQKKQLFELISFFEQPLQFLNAEVEQQLNLLAVTLAQQLVRREIRAEPGEIIAVIRESVKMLPLNSRKIKIFLHPEDAEIVRNTLQLNELDEEQSWKLMEDPMITRGGCEIKSEQSTINVTLENRLQALAASILGGDRIEDQSEDKNDSSTD